MERQLEAVLDQYGIFYEKTETWIESERLYEVLVTSMFPPLLLTITRRLRIGKTTRIKSGQLRIIPRSLEVKAND